MQFAGMSRSSARLAFLTIATLSAVPASSSRAGPGGPYEACGLLEVTPGFPSCLVFTADDGLRLVPETLGGFQAGDRVLVSGTVNTNVAFVCGGELVFPLQQNTIGACFAGCGTLETDDTGTCLYFVSAEQGERFRLEELGGLPAGTQVYVSGRVDPAPAACGDQLLPAIVSNVTGPCHRATGRLISTFGCVNLVAFTGERYDIEHVSRFVAGDYVTVEGLLSGEDLGACGNLLVQANTLRADFGGPGTIVADAHCGIAFEADEGGFNSRYRLENGGSFAAGDRVVVTGRFAEACAAVGDCALPCIMDNTIDALFAQSGQFAGNSGECAVFLPDDGNPPLTVEHSGGLPPGTPVFVTGAVSIDSPVCVASEVPVLRHNTADPFIDICGDLLIGFECTPILSTSLGVFWVENLDFFVLGDRVRVRGAVTSGCVDMCPYVCIRYNRIDVCVPGDLNGDGVVTDPDVPLFVDVLLGLDANPYRRNASDTNDDGWADSRDIPHFLTAYFLVCPDCG